ncbi:GNAT family N-acetyltransferase [Streptococcus macedonicus]|uniref:GNAT family N-acetyltransferase n=1 Tax=Streptococcus macedonicus TaxID=59310 RepID=UPI000C123AA8|nr:GNAT family N-acetyltransferase [Streptococcus macedonicus]PHV60357.1 hypothetical protein CS005_02075 [Streptococcus macedonicus]
MITERLRQYQILETERLILRPVTLADAEAMFAYVSDEENTRWNFSANKTLEETKAAIKNIYLKTPLGLYGIALKGTNAFKGMTRISFDNPGGWDSANLYAYYGNPVQIPLGAWPGQSMTKDAQGNFYIDLPEEYLDLNVKIIFNQPGTSNQFPTSIGFDLVKSGNYNKDGLK